MPTITITKKDVARGVRRLARQEPTRANAKDASCSCVYKPSEVGYERGHRPCLIGTLVTDIVGTDSVWDGVTNSKIDAVAHQQLAAKGVVFTPKALILAAALQEQADDARLTPWSEIVPQFTTSSD